MRSVRRASARDRMKLEKGNRGTMAESRTKKRAIGIAPSQVRSGILPGGVMLPESDAPEELDWSVTPLVEVSGVNNPSAARMD